MGRMKELAMEGGETRSSSKAKPEFWDRYADRKPRARTPQVTMPIDRDIRHLQDSFPAPRFVTKRGAQRLHIRLSKIGVPEGRHYETARLMCIALGLMTKQAPALCSLTELSMEQYDGLMVATFGLLGVEA